METSIAILLLASVAHLAAGADEVKDELSRAIETDPTAAANAATESGGEIVRMRWKLGGFLGFVAGLFVPSSGDALLTFVPNGAERQEIQLLITTPGRQGEYFLYGAEIDPGSTTTTAVWSSYVFKDRKREREQRIEQKDVIDFASAIYHLRNSPPRRTTRFTIWNGGSTYPVEVEPLRPERRKISGQPTDVQGFEVRGVEVDGQKAFEEKFTLYFARDSRSTPVGISAKRGMIRLRMERVGPPIASSSARPPG
jgi:hypothetical protein